ncbi:MAG TPA: hypothetical protein VGG26_09010 [Terracidiphilus sp.]
MRPKKRILLIAAHEDRASELRYQLDLWGFAVMSAATAGEAREWFEAGRVELIVAEHNLAGFDVVPLLDGLRRANGWVPQLLLAPRLTMAPEGAVADAVLTKGYTAEQLRHSVKGMAARKRGPRKKDPARVTLADIVNAIGDRRPA